MLAEHGQEHVGLPALPLLPSLEADPLLGAAVGDLGLAHHGDVVLGRAGDHARLAARAGIHLNRHPPAVARALDGGRQAGLAPAFRKTSCSVFALMRPPLAKAPGKSCPSPMATATAPGCSVFEGQAGSSMLPCGEVSLTMSPRPSPSLSAVSTGTSTQPSHATWVMTSGASWSHGLSAERPS